ncbi:MAG: hypothetical protein WDN00_07850 [Limisphaerales bacterium]
MQATTVQIQLFTRKDTLSMEQNSATVQRFEYSETNAYAFSPLWIMEEGGTNSTMLLPDIVFTMLANKPLPERLAHLISSKFSLAVEAIKQRRSLSEEDVKYFLLECFQIHEVYAERLGYGKGHTGPPYNIYEVTTNSAVQVSK